MELDTENPDGGENPIGGEEANSGIFQELTNLTIGQTYDLSFWYLSRTGTIDDNGIDVYWGNTLDANVLAPSTIGHVDLEQTASVNNFQNWTKYSFLLTATHSEMKVGFGATGLQNEEGGLIDNVSLVAVPEPTTLVLFLGGLLGLGLRRKHS